MRRTRIALLAFSCVIAPATLALAQRVPGAAPRIAPLPTASAAADDAGRLVAALLGDTPLVDDLEALTDRIGGRATGSPANLRAVDWALERFRDAGVTARREPFTVPALWLERSARATVHGIGAGPGTGGAGIEFSPRVAAMPFSTATAQGGVTAPLVDGGFGSDSDFARLRGRARGAFVLIEQPELRDIDGLFKEYDEASKIEQRAFAAGVAGVVYMGSRPNDLLYRHNVAVGAANTRPMIVMETDGARRALRLLRRGVALTLTEQLDIHTGGNYQSWNVIGEIPGAVRPEEIVVVGSHLDSWDLGDGALDNGANAVMMIDLARQIRRLGIRPARTIRFALWNGEEQGMLGSMGYTRTHADEMDRTIVAAAFDIGCGRIDGFFTNGRAELLAPVERALRPVAGLGPFAQVNAPIVGTDNYDFMLEGVPNLVANQEPASYGPNYHARSDTFDKCDAQQLRLNAAVAGALTLAFANDTQRWPRQTRADLDRLMRTTDLPAQMKSFGLWEEWVRGERGRR